MANAHLLCLICNGINSISNLEVENKQFRLHYGIYPLSNFRLLLSLLFGSQPAYFAENIIVGVVQSNVLP